MPYKIRFHLGKENGGQHYAKWRVEDMKHKTVCFYDPDHVTLVLTDCVLRNGKKTALKIFNGATKRVCAYIKCEEVNIFYSEQIKILPKEEYKFSPKRKPYWTESYGCDCDNTKVDLLYTKGRGIFRY